MDDQYRLVNHLGHLLPMEIAFGIRRQAEKVVSPFCDLAGICRAVHENSTHAYHIIINEKVKSDFHDPERT